MNEEIVVCDKCGEQATLVISKEGGDREAWVCHVCKHIIAYKPEDYSRVEGYLRPVKQWNKGKRQEFKERTVFKNTVDDS